MTIPPELRRITDRWVLRCWEWKGAKAERQSQAAFTAAHAQPEGTSLWRTRRPREGPPKAWDLLILGDPPNVAKVESRLLTNQLLAAARRREPDAGLREALCARRLNTALEKIAAGETGPNVIDHHHYEHGAELFRSGKMKPRSG